jgi:hypothetical protein
MIVLANLPAAKEYSRVVATSSLILKMKAVFKDSFNF